MPTVVGIDISGATVDICILWADGAEPVPRWTIANIPAGVACGKAKYLGIAVPPIDFEVL